MRRKVVLFGVPVVTLVLGALRGFAVAQRQYIASGNRLLIQELAYGLSIHSEAASLIRVGDTDRALWWLDQWIDRSVVPVATHPHGTTTLRGLELAKVYRRAVPSTGPEATHLTSALDRVADLPGPYFCPLPAGGEARASGLDRLAGTPPH